jgi:hypothetical protein
VVMWGSGGICIELEEGKAEGVGQSETRNEGDRSEPIGSLQAAGGRGRVRERELHSALRGSAL